MAQSSAVASGDLATSTQFNNLRNDILSTTLGHHHDGTNGREHGDSNLKLRNPGNTYSYTVRTGTIGANYDLILPTITGNDTLVSLALAQTLVNKTLTTPTITSFANATHDHADSAGGGSHVAASTTVAGVIELATATETSGGSLTTRAITPDGLAGSSIFGTQTIQMVVVDFTSDVTTGNGKFVFHIPSTLQGMNLDTVHALVVTDGSGGVTTIQLYNITDSQDMLSTPITIDSGEVGSDTAATAAVINTSYDDVAENDRIQVDIDTVSSTPPKGLIVTLTFLLP